jgi:hypothetical protein
VVNALEKAKKNKFKRRTGRDWAREGPRTGISQESAKTRLIEVEEKLKDLEASQEEKRQRWLEADQQQYLLSVHERGLSKLSRLQYVSGENVTAFRMKQQQQAYHDL